MKISIEGMGIAAPFGSAVELKTLLLGETTQHTPSSSTTATDALKTFVPPRKLRRIDHFTRMVLLAAYRALDDAGSLETLPDNLGIIISTGYGPSQTTFDFLDSIIEDGARLASPLAFSHSVHNIPAGVLSLLLGTPCPQTTLCQLKNPVVAGLQTAALWLAEKRVDNVLFGAVDETTPLLIDTTARLAREQGRDITTPVSEGATFFLLNNKGRGHTSVEMNRSLADLKGLPLFSHSKSPGAPDLRTLFGAMPTSGALNLAAAALHVQGKNTCAGCCEQDTWLRVSRNPNG